MLDGYKTIIASGIAFIVAVLEMIGLDVGKIVGVPALTDAVLLIATALAGVFRYIATRDLRSDGGLQ